MISTYKVTVMFPFIVGVNLHTQCNVMQGWLDCIRIHVLDGFQINQRICSSVVNDPNNINVYKVDFVLFSVMGEHENNHVHYTLNSDDKTIEDIVESIKTYTGAPVTYTKV